MEVQQSEGISRFARNDSLYLIMGLKGRGA